MHCVQLDECVGLLAAQWPELPRPVLEEVFRQNGYNLEAANEQLSAQTEYERQQVRNSRIAVSCFQSVPPSWKANFLAEQTKLLTCLLCNKKYLPVLQGMWPEQMVIVHE